MSTNCKFFTGKSPCKHYWKNPKLKCNNNCSFFKKYQERIVIIKRGSAGDIIKTTPILRGLKKKHPNSEITWIIEEKNKDLLLNNPFVERVIVDKPEIVRGLISEQFDLLISLDKDYESLSLVNLISAKKKMGFGMNKKGKVIPLNKEAKYFYKICTDNWGLKKTNNKTYQEMFFEIMGIPWQKEDYVLELTKEEENKARKWLEKNNVSKKDFVIGINTGCNPSWGKRMWDEKEIVKFIELSKKFNPIILLFGGNLEAQKNQNIKKKSKYKKLIDTTNKFSLRQFAGIIKQCDVIITGDTLAMNLALAVKTKSIILFGPTPVQEIEDFKRSTKLCSKLDCLNCYGQIPCTKKPDCMELIKPEKVIEEILKIKK